MTTQEMELFHKNRLTGLGGSDMPLVCGKSPYGGPSKVYMQKLELEPPSEPNERMEAGTRLESTIADWFADYRQVRVEKPKKMLRHPKVPWAICHLDGLIYNGNEAPLRPLEVKNVGLDMSYLWGTVDDDIPESVIIQCQHNLFVASGALAIDFDGCEVAALIGGNEPRFNLFVPRNEKMIEAMREIGDKLWYEHIEKKIPPPPDGLPGSSELLSALFPYSNEMVVNADDICGAYVETLLNVRSQIKALDVEKLLCENKIKEKLGNAGVLMSEHGKITWKRTKDGEKTDWRALATSIGYSADQLAEFTKLKEGHRRFCCPRGK